MPKHQTPKVSEKVVVEIVDPKTIGDTELQKMQDIFAESFATIPFYQDRLDKLRQLIRKEVIALKNMDNLRNLIICKDRETGEWQGFIIASLKGYPNFIYFRQGAIIPKLKNHGLAQAMVFAFLEKYSKAQKLVVITRHSNNEALPVYVKHFDPDSHVFSEVPEIVQGGYSQNDFEGFSKVISCEDLGRETTDFFERRSSAVANRVRGQNSAGVAACLNHGNGQRSQSSNTATIMMSRKWDSSQVKACLGG